MSASSTERLTMCPARSTDRKDGVKRKCVKCVLYFIETNRNYSLPILWYMLVQRVCDVGFSGYIAPVPFIGQIFLEDVPGERVREPLV
jgi:hypothetical protein